MAWIQRYPNRNHIIPTTLMTRYLKETGEDMEKKEKTMDDEAREARTRMLSLRPTKRRKIRMEAESPYHATHPEETNKHGEIGNPRPTWVNTDGTRNEKYTLLQLRTLQMLAASHTYTGNWLLTLFPHARGPNARRNAQAHKKLGTGDEIAEFITRNIDFFRTLETLLPGPPIPEEDFLLDGNLNR